MQEKIIRPIGPLLEGDQAIVDAIQRLPAQANVIYEAPHETVILDFTGSRETTPGLPKDHWSIAFLETDDEGMPEKVETTLLTISAKDINVVLRGGDIATEETRTEEDKPKAVERAKLHDSKTEQAIKLQAAERLNRAAGAIIRIA